MYTYQIITLVTLVLGCLFPFGLAKQPKWSGNDHDVAKHPHSQSQSQSQSQWSGWGAGILNNRWASQNSAIHSSNAGSLEERCHFDYTNGVSATPTIHGNIAYFPTWDGELVALDYTKCEVVWTISVSDIINEFAPLNILQTSFTRSASRSSPQVDGSVLYFTTLAHALLVAVDRGTGALLAVTQINNHELATLTMSPTFYDGTLFIGASSQEEAAAIFPGYVCCTFVGNMAAVTFDKDTRNFTVVWSVDLLPPAGDTVPSWSGVAVWGSQPAIDQARSQVFVATGNVYTVPPEFDSCLNDDSNDTCIPADVLQEAVLAFDIDTGDIKWSRVVSPLDAWTLACGASGLVNLPLDTALCPTTPGPDADFGMAPTFVPGSEWTPQGLDIVVIGQKNGVLHALSAQSGAPLWSTATSPDGVEGGLIWGIAVDDKQAYFTGVNSNLDTWQVQPSNETIDNSAFGAASLLDGSIIWETPSPLDSISLVPPSVVNDVVFTGRTGENITGAYNETEGGLIVLDKYTGKIIKNYNLAVNFHGGIAIQDEYVLFGSGYNGFLGTGAFHVYHT